MATFVVCLRCGKVHETDGIDQLPKGWQRSHADLFCPRCSETDEVVVDVFEEEVIYPASDSTVGDTLDDGYCEVCDGPCQGH